MQIDRIPENFKHFRRLQSLPTFGPSGFGCSQRELDLRQAVEELDVWLEKVQQENLLAFPTQEQKQYWFYTFNEATFFWLCKMMEPDHEWPCIQGAWIDICERENEPDFIDGGHVFHQWGTECLPDQLATWEDPDLIRHVEEAFEILSNDWEQCQTRKLFERKMTRIRFLQKEEPMPTSGHRAVKKGHANARERALTQLTVPQEFEKVPEWEQAFHSFRFDQWAAEKPTPIWSSIKQAPVFLVVHLFSGRRREDDVHHWLSHYAVLKGIQLVVLSLDTAVDKDLGNLFHRGVPWRRLERLFLQGLVAAMLAGSPCETFSARHNSLDNGRQGPRPLRSTSRLWGLAGLRLKELRQLSFGSSFELQVLWGSPHHRRTGSKRAPWNAKGAWKSLYLALWTLDLLRLCSKTRTFACIRSPSTYLEHRRSRWQVSFVWDCHGFDNTCWRDSSLTSPSLKLRLLR